MAEAVLREISALLFRDLKDPRLRGVSLTQVKMSADLRHARVHFSVLEGSAQAAEAIEGFRSAAGFIRQKVGRALGMRYFPELSFELDTSAETAARIDALLKEQSS